MKQYESNTNELTIADMLGRYDGRESGKATNDSTDSSHVISEGCLELERQLTLGSYIGWQDSQWWLFRKDGEGIQSGRSIEELLFKLYI